MSQELDTPAFGGEEQDISVTEERRQFLTSMKKRSDALKALTARLAKIDTELHQEIHKLELKHDRLRQEILEKRSSILSGDYEPTEEDCNYPSEGEIESDICRLYPNCNEKTKGIPKFWLTALKNSKIVAKYIKEYDEPILSYLQDIKAKVHEFPMGFTLEFHFAKNEYFTNKVLIKNYEKIIYDPSKDRLFSNQVPEIRAVRGCKINWKEGKNVTIDVTKEVTQISISKFRTDTKITQRDSFFDFFSLPDIPSSFGPLREQFEKHRLRLLRKDSILGQHIKNKIVPRAFLYFSGEIRNEDVEEIEEKPDSEEGNFTCNII
ncbi:UNVERIFIED_CONTAM: hypothetical protein RMT77_014162 [Armadillidium vulgare]